MKRVLSVWYDTLKTPAGTKFEIEGRTEKGEIIYSQIVDVDQLSASETVKMK